MANIANILLKWIRPRRQGEHKHTPASTSMSSHIDMVVDVREVTVSGAMTELMKTAVRHS